jgi:hypothetical protein
MIKAPAYVTVVLFNVSLRGWVASPFSREKERVRAAIRMRN